MPITFLKNKLDGSFRPAFAETVLSVEGWNELFYRSN